jgi:t-SNARE complex subunit (syntaxin)
MNIENIAKIKALLEKVEAYRNQIEDLFTTMSDRIREQNKKIDNINKKLIEVEQNKELKNKVETIEQTIGNLSKQMNIIKKYK